MQSQLEAALLGHSANANLEDDEKDFQDEEGDDVDDFIDEVSFFSAYYHRSIVSLFLFAYLFCVCHFHYRMSYIINFSAILYCFFQKNQ